MRERQPQHIGWRAVDAFHEGSTPTFDTEGAGEGERVASACVGPKLLLGRAPEPDQGAGRFTCSCSRSCVDQEVPGPEGCHPTGEAGPHIEDLSLRMWFAQ